MPPALFLPRSSALYSWAVSAETLFDFLIDPDTGFPFYIGKGKDNRVFNHMECALESETSTDKYEKIREILNSNKKLEHIIVRHGLTEKVAFEIEASLIDTFDYINQGITNIAGGHKSIEKGLMSSDEIKRLYNADKLSEIENNCIEAGRKGTGDLPMMLDTNCPWTYEQTLAKKDFLKSMNLTWLEEPIYPPEDYQTLAKLNKELGIPLACGENACTEYEFKSMIDHKAVSFVQPSVIKVGGIYEMFKIINIAEDKNISVMPHTAYFGPGFLATLQLAALMKKETYIERFYLDIDEEFYPNFKKALNGKYNLPKGPGLGIDLDYKRLSKYEI